jgi:selenocysteine lyase/cysteine desulfurase
MFVGLEWLLSRPTALADRLLRGLRAIPNVQVVTPPEPASRGPVAVFRIAGWHPDDAIAELGRRVFAILGAVVLHDGPAVRASLGAFNDERELDRLLDAVELLASHTAETLPRRTALTILRG